jgi:hypothetical protein
LGGEICAVFEQHLRFGLLGYPVIMRDYRPHWSGSAASGHRFAIASPLSLARSHSTELTRRGLATMTERHAPDAR